jgi:hypothetical protein
MDLSLNCFFCRLSDCGCKKVAKTVITIRTAETGVPMAVFSAIDGKLLISTTKFSECFKKHDKTKLWDAFSTEIDRADLNLWLKKRDSEPCLLLRLREKSFVWLEIHEYVGDISLLRLITSSSSLVMTPTEINQCLRSPENDGPSSSASVSSCKTTNLSFISSEYIQSTRENAAYSHNDGELCFDDLFQSNSNEAKDDGADQVDTAEEDSFYDTDDDYSLSDEDSLMGSMIDEEFITRNRLNILSAVDL